MGRVLLSCIIVSLYYCNMQNAHVTIINDLLTYLLTYYCLNTCNSCYDEYYIYLVLYLLYY